MSISDGIIADKSELSDGVGAEFGCYSILKSKRNYERCQIFVRR